MNIVKATIKKAVLKEWRDLPKDMRNEAVLPYYEALEKKIYSLLVKRLFDIVGALTLLIALSPAMGVIALLIKKEGDGPILYRQIRLTQYGRAFRIHKFRTMVINAEKKGEVTVGDDARITSIGKVLRKYRMDEFPQLIDILKGDMSFVGTRPEVPYHAKDYTDQMKATYLMKAGITSNASIQYKDEAKLLEGADDCDAMYRDVILPAKMAYNLEDIQKFSLWRECKILLHTVKAVLE